MTLIPITAGFTALILTLVWVMFCLIYEVVTPVGIWLRLAPAYTDRLGSPDLVAPIVVHVSLVNHQSVYTINGLVVPSDALSIELKKQLKLRSQWLVYVDGDSATLELRDVARVIDVANTLHAKVVLVTPKTRPMAAR
jgi:hypothetical protein